MRSLFRLLSPARIAPRPPVVQRDTIGFVLDDVDLSTRLFGKTLKAPLLITGMTGGSDRAGQVNRDLAEALEHIGQP